MTPSNANTSGLEVVAKVVSAHGDPEAFGEREIEVVADLSRIPYRTDLVTAASAQARIAELEAERDQIAGESIWWKTVIGDGEYTPSGEVPSIKHLHPAMVKPIYEAHKGTAVADVIAGLIFSRAITENREQFLVGYHINRATAAEARADSLAKALERIERWFGEFPATGKFWHNADGSISDRPMPYGACWGSNGERDFMRSVARAALQQKG